MSSRLLFSIASSAAALALAAIACGGSSQTELFGPEGASTSATEPPRSSGNAASGGATPPSSSGGSSSSSGGSSSSSSSSSGGSSGGSSSGDAGPPQWKSPGILCGANEAGDVYCPTTTDLCCAHNHRDGDEFQCVAGGATSCATGISIRCDDRTDCPSGQVCCATFDPNFGYRSVQCQTQCTTNIPNATSVRFCDPNAPVDECAAIGKDCTPSGSLDGFSYCR
jgi:hypothetical protein